MKKPPTTQSFNPSTPQPFNNSTIQQFNLFKGVYAGKRILLTGHTGFKGSWLAFWLKQMGADVLGYALEPNTNPNHFSMLDLPIESVIGDIRDGKKLSDVFKRF